jgi:putative DNA primase/helicase
VKIPEVQPWPEPVNLAEVLHEIVGQLQRFVVVPKWAAETLALWIVHTFAYELRDIATYIGIESPEKECGKSTLITLLSQFVNRAAVSSNISPSAFFRVIEDLKPTLLIDEADTNLRGKDDLAGILNSSYTLATGFVWRICYDPVRELAQAGEDGDTNSAGHVARYSSWCPKAIAAIGHLHPTLASRCIVIRMQRKTAREECERLKRLNATDLKRKCARFVGDNAEAIQRADPQMPPDLANRAADVWEPLLVLADLAGGQWPKLARDAALGLTARAQDNSPIGSLLLDIYLAFVLAKVDRMFSRDFVTSLSGHTDRPWLELRRGKPLTETWLAQQLRPYGVKPKTIRIGDDLGKGYMQQEMMETFRRYIPKAEFEAFLTEMKEPNAHAGTPPAKENGQDQNASGKEPGGSCESH